MKSILLTQNKQTLVDDDLYEELMSVASWSFDGRYVKGRMRGSKKIIFMHRYIMYAMKGYEVDHINQDKLDNRKENLRLCNSTVNKINTPKRAGTTSQYRGVHWSTLLNRWIAQISMHRKQHRIGVFDSELEAAVAYDKAALELHKGYARLNFKEEPNHGEKEKLRTGIC